MDVPIIENTAGSGGIDALRLKRNLRLCQLYKEEICSAPRIRFEACRTCVRINVKSAVRGLFGKIKDLAVQMFNLQATEPSPPPSSSSAPR